MKICFLSMSAFPLLTGKNFGTAGGAEVQLVSLAKKLISRGFDISFITYDYGQKEFFKINNMNIIKTYSFSNQSMNFFMKFYKINKALRTSDSDLYLCSADSHGILPFYCFLNRKKYVFRIPSDNVVLANKKKNLVIHFAELIDLKFADAVIVQSKFQLQKLQENFGINGFVIKNSLPLPANQFKKSNPPHVLWVGSISPVKQPHLLLRLAEKFPKTIFHIVGGKAPGHSNLYFEIEQLALCQKNVRFHGFVPYSEILKYFEFASLFVNTSVYEGFPNTFLQAWSNYLPVVSLNVDPDGIIEENNLGFCSKNFDKFVSDVGFLLENGSVRKKIGYNSREYVEREHDITLMAERYISVFDKLDI